MKQQKQIYVIPLGQTERKPFAQATPKELQLGTRVIVTKDGEQELTQRQLDENAAMLGRKFEELHRRMR